MSACVLHSFKCVRLLATLWTVARQAPLSMGLSRQEYWSGLPFPSPKKKKREMKKCLEEVVFEASSQEWRCEFS